MTETAPRFDEPARARVGVRDVARAAGVSAQTVSRVINGNARIRPETRQRVLDAMAALGYRVNNAARALGTRTTRTLGIIVTDATLYGPSVGIAALEAAARASERWIATAYADADDATSVLAAAERLLSLGVDGLVVLAPHVPTLQALAAAHREVPLGALHADAGAQRQSEGAALAVAHLVGLGHRRIGHVTGPEDWLEAGARERGVERALRDAGLVRGPQWRGDWSAAAGAALAPRVAAAVRSEGGPTAIVVANDQMALGLVAGLGEAGLSVPQDVSVTGFDDNPDAAFYHPALTTVQLDMAGEARRTVATVLGAPAIPPDPPVLVVRASTSSPA